MSFFDKFFSNKNRNKSNENELKPDTENFRSSHLSISKDQVRFVLFRECDKRGRKLLFDSNSVEKIMLSRENMCSCTLSPKNEKLSEFIETHNTYAYKYKKPLSDVSSLGELVFGSVAVIYKGGNSYKIHSIPSPKRLMFSSIVNAPSKYLGNIASEFHLGDSRESSQGSLSSVLNQQQTSSSDSKLYMKEGVPQKYSSTYPWIKQTFPFYKLKECCDKSGAHYNLSKKSYSRQSSDLNKVEGASCECRSKEVTPAKLEHINSSENNFCLCQNNFDCERDSSNYDSSGITSNESDNLSSISGSLSSLKRRWIHSYSTSLDSTTYDDTSNSSSKRRTKLGMALILDLSNTLENEIEELLFNHTIVIDSAMCKLQAYVELGYIKNENFVDLIHTAFLDCQQSIHGLITGGNYKMPIWCLRTSNYFLEAQFAELNLSKKKLGTSSNFWVNASKHDLVPSVQFRFLIDFCDVLAKFDTKDTNFFISTLLTAVLTHHLSWVTSIAETEQESSKEKLSVISSSSPYNPIWARMNDLCGLLGSPLKSVKTVVTGTRKNQVSAIIKMLHYFIRCSNISENVYEVDVEDIVRDTDLENARTKFDSISKRSREINFKKEKFDCQGACETDTKLCAERAEEKVESGSGKKVLLAQETNLKKTDSEVGLKRTKSYLSHAKMNDAIIPNELYPDIRDLAKRENINISELFHVENEMMVADKNFLNSEKIEEEMEKMIGVPKRIVVPPDEGSLDEGYETIDSSKTDYYRGNTVQVETQRSAPLGVKRENIVFLLGENEELVNLQKKIVVNKSSFVDIETEDSRQFSRVFERDKDLSSAYALFRESVRYGSESEESDRTLKSLCGIDHKPLRLTSGSEKIEEPFEGKTFPAKPPWTFYEMKMPRSLRPCLIKRLEVSSVMGDVNELYNSEQIIQGVLEPRNLLEQTLQKDLLLCAHNPILEKNIKEALCILGDMSSWEVVILSGNESGGLNRHKRSGIRVGMSQLVADMLESFKSLHTCNLPPSFCLDHIEKKLREIYSKSKTVAELLTSKEFCSMEYLTAKLDIGINDVPLLLSVATTHSPQIAEKYHLSFS